MKKVAYPLLAVVILVLSGFSAFKVQEWKIEDDFSIKFDSKDPSGKFSKFSGTIKFNENDLTNSKFDVTIPVSSINCGSNLQNRHAIGPNWFDAKKYPNITYKSKSITKSEEGFMVTGTLKIRNIEKELSFPFTFKDETFEASFTVDRRDFEIGDPTNHASKELAMTVKVPVSK
ncbi:MAG: YceI family protein [Bacteroidetes bacterium]|nr:YceI family protein [Bacteroidota bacterium]